MPPSSLATPPSSSPSSAPAAAPTPPPAPPTAPPSTPSARNARGEALDTPPHAGQWDRCSPVHQRQRLRHQEQGVPWSASPMAHRLLW
ncbi:uncharacterized protein M6B38_389995 [Iris pallida]|uniref:Uncharacterized protein n=1 Tax=Iris pallida TaxID=29817 RepID=A0AAX6G0J7_IRIPA|nr:uncharacterized protein M6B38_389995 [Iris pallida]